MQDDGNLTPEFVLGLVVIALVVLLLVGVALGVVCSWAYFSARDWYAARKRMQASVAEAAELVRWSPPAPRAAKHPPDTPPPPVPPPLPVDPLVDTEPVNVTPRGDNGIDWRDTCLLTTEFPRPKAEDGDE